MNEQEPSGSHKKSKIEVSQSKGRMVFDSEAHDPIWKKLYFCKSHSFAAFGFWLHLQARFLCGTERACSTPGIMYFLFYTLKRKEGNI